MQRRTRGKLWARLMDHLHLRGRRAQGNKPEMANHAPPTLGNPSPTRDPRHFRPILLN